MKRILLIFPPQADPTMPAQPLAALQGYLKQQFRDLEIRVVDANVEAYDYILRGTHLAGLYEQVQKNRRRLEKHGLNGQEDYYRALGRVGASGPHVIAAVDWAKKILRDKTAFYDHENYYFASSIVTRALQLVSAAHYPALLDIGGYSIPYGIDRLVEILDAAKTQNRYLDPFLTYYRDRLYPEVESFSPDMIGISMSYPSQVHQSFLLAREFRGRYRQTPCIIGGSMIPVMKEGLPAAEPLFKWVTAFVTHEGEITLAALIREWRRGGDLARAPGIIYLDGGGKVRETAPQYPPDLDLLPLPDFTGYPLHLYLSGQTVLPYSLGRGCYWGKCAFCCQDILSRAQPRKKSPHTVSRQLRLLKEQYPFSHLYISDEGFDAETLATLGDIIAGEKLGIRWCSDARLETSWQPQTFARAARGGCVKLWFGLESFNQRILDKIGKGIRQSSVSAIIRDCRRAGILVHLYCMFSFPGETPEEACATLRFLLENRSIIDTAAFNVFRLHRYSALYRHPDRYPIKLLSPGPEQEFPKDFPYETTAGMTAEEARRFCYTLREHPAVQPFMAPYVLSKAHILLLAARNPGYRDAILQMAQAIKDRPAGYLPPAAGNKSKSIRKRSPYPGKTNICRFLCDPFAGGKEGTGGETTGQTPVDILYIPWQDRHFALPGAKITFPR
jgi:anaerobic magnesium-protoporphyrin IX monomethyl ester cyclase